MKWILKKSTSFPISYFFSKLKIIFTKFFVSAWHSFSLHVICAFYFTEHCLIWEVWNQQSWHGVSALWANFIIGWIAFKMLPTIISSDAASQIFLYSSKRPHSWLQFELFLQFKHCKLKSNFGHAIEMQQQLLVVFPSKLLYK